MSKGRLKSAVAVQHTKLRDRDTANRFKQYWSERLDALAEVIGVRPGSDPGLTPTRVG
jgi:hypothetical protein